MIYYNLFRMKDTFPCACSLSLIHCIQKFVIVGCFQVVGIILIVAAVYGRASSQVTNLPIVSGILGCGVFLILVSILGLFGAVKHNQVILFFVSFTYTENKQTI